MNTEEKQRPGWSDAYRMRLNREVAIALGWQQVGMKYGVPPGNEVDSTQHEIPNYFEGDVIFKIMLQHQIGVLYSVRGYGILNPHMDYFDLWIEHAYHEELLTVYRVLLAEAVVHRFGGKPALQKIW